MKNILFFSDLHISQSSLEECRLVLQEICELANKYFVDSIISLGDTFDNRSPSSKELDLFSLFLQKMGNRKIIIIAAQSHESTTLESSILNHFGILKNNIKIVKEFKDGNHLFCGHFCIKESLKNYDAKLSKEDLKQYVYCLLGHCHTFHLIKPNICHLGSSRWVNFDESEDKYKIVALITNYNTQAEKIHFLKLKTPIKMLEIKLNSNNTNELQKNTQKEGVSDGSLNQNQGSEGLFCAKKPINLSLCQDILNKTDPNTKVKVKILDFESFKQFLPLASKYANKFHLFKYETDFTTISTSSKKEQIKLLNFKQSFKDWIEQQKIDNKIKEVLQEELE